MSVDLQHNLEERMRRELPHLTAEDRCALVRIVERLVEAYQPDRIYLFGSKVRGDYGPDAVDLATVLALLGDTAFHCMSGSVCSTKSKLS